MTRVTCGLTATNRDQLRNPTLRSVIEYGLPFIVGEFALWRNRQLSMSVVALVRIVCFAVFLLRLFNFCLLYKFSATMHDGEIKLYIIIRSSCMLTYLLFLSPCADRRRDDGNKPVADGGGRCLDNNDAGAARGWISSQTGQRRRGL